MSFFSKLSRMFGKDNAKWEEKRQFIRLTAHHLLKYKVIGGSPATSFIRNISAGGVLFYSKEDFPQDTMIEMEINFPHYPHPIKAVAKIIRTKSLGKIGGDEVGAEFINVDEEAKDFINKKIVTVYDEVHKEDKDTKK